MANRHERSVPDMMTELFGQYATLFRAETRLVRSEMSDKVRQVGTGLALVVAGSVLITPGLVVLLGAAVVALQEAGLEPPWASLAVGGGVLLIGVVLLLVGLNLFKADKLVPARTIHQFQQDASVAKRQVRREDEQQRAA